MDSLEQLAAQLHGEVLKDLLERIKAGEATVAELNVARQFLKDNGIDSFAKKGGNLKKLSDALPFNSDEEDVPLTKEG